MIERPQLLQHRLMCSLSSPRHRIFSELLPRKRGRLSRHWLTLRNHLAIHWRWWNCSLLKREQTSPGLPIEHINVSALARLHHCVNQFSLMAQGHKQRRRWEVQVPHIMADGLKMPFALPRHRVQAYQGISKQIVAMPVCSIKVEGSRAGWHKNQPAFHIYRRAGPVIGRSRSLPRTWRPGVIPELPRMRNRMKAPAKFSGRHIIRSDVARRGRKHLRGRTAKNQEITIN